MKVKFSIEKGQMTEKTATFSTKQIDMYHMSATFTPSEAEKKIYNDHPLFKKVLFMKYKEEDRTTTGIVFVETKVDDNEKIISIETIYNSPTIQFKAYSIGRIIELRSLILEAGANFAGNVKVLEELICSDEVEFVAQSKSLPID